MTYLAYGIFGIGGVLATVAVVSTIARHLAEIHAALFGDVEDMRRELEHRERPITIHPSERSPQ